MMKVKEQKGITLIALVITIIVLLILAGVALSALTGDSGILTNADKAKESTIKGNIKEVAQLAVQRALIDKWNGEGKITTENLEKELGNKYTVVPYDTGWEIKDEAGNTAWIGKTGEVVLGKTLGSVFGDVEIATTKISYETTKALPEGIDWVIIGYDESGNILATASTPLGGDYIYTVNRTAEEFCKYESALDAHCNNFFSETLQNKTINVRSIRGKDINALTGFVEPEFNKYIYKNTQTNLENKIVGHYHPDISATSTDFYSKKTAEYKKNAYSYGKDLQCTFYDSSIQYPPLTKLDNVDFVFGNNFSYLVADTAMYMVVSKSTSYFAMSYIDIGTFGRGSISAAICTSESYEDARDSDSVPDDKKTYEGNIRPVIILPSTLIVKDIEIEEDGDGKITNISLVK